MNTLQYLHALYGRCEAGAGEIVLVESTKRRPVAVFRLHEIDFAAGEAASHLDLYLKVNLMDCRKMADRLGEKLRTQGYGTVVGNRSEVKTVVGLHLDADAGKSSKYHSRDEVLGILNRMPVPPSLIVNSDGPEGGFHPYWLLRNPILIDSEETRERISAIAFRWQEHLKRLADGKVDSTANIDRVLRVVGTRRSNGNWVSCEHYDPKALYEIDELTLPATDDEIRREVSQQVRVLANETLGPVERSDEPITAYINASFLTPEALLAEAGYEQLRDPLEWRRPGAANPGRSLKIATSHDRPGINVFSGGDPVFACLKSNGSAGKYYSVDEMFVRLRHGGNWKAAARWCRERIEAEADRRSGVDIRGLMR